MDWLMRPVLRGAIPYTELLRTNIGLEDLAFMHDALDVIDENEARARLAMDARAEAQARARR
jgi:hypothetical protein